MKWIFPHNQWPNWFFIENNNVSKGMSSIFLNGLFPLVLNSIFIISGTISLIIVLIVSSDTVSLVIVLFITVVMVTEVIVTLSVWEGRGVIIVVGPLPLGQGWSTSSPGSSLESQSVILCIFFPEYVMLCICLRKRHPWCDRWRRRRKVHPPSISKYSSFVFFIKFD